MYRVRHGETVWSAGGQHTGVQDVSLTAQGERNGEALAPRCRSIAMYVFTISSCLLEGLSTSNLIQQCSARLLKQHPVKAAKDKHAVPTVKHLLSLIRSACDAPQRHPAP